MKRAQRVIALTLLRNTNVLLCHLNHQLYMIVNRECKEGLSDKEKAFLMKRHATLTKVQVDFTNITNLIHRQYNAS